VGDDGEPRDVDAACRVWPRCSARRRGDDDARDLPVARVVLYHAPGCSLCEKARDVLAGSGEPFEEVDISRNPELEAEYREWLPVVEIGGERAFVYFVDPEALKRRLKRSGDEATKAGG
jgi:glutaredoxin